MNIQYGNIIARLVMLDVEIKMYKFNKNQRSLALPDFPRKIISSAAIVVVLCFTPS